MGALEKNILEHIGLMAQEQVDIEFQQETMMLQQLQQQAQQNPQAQQQLQQIVMKIEARKAVLISEMMEEFMKEEKKITSQFDHDPLLKLKSREIDLKAMENERKKEETGARIGIDKAKLVQNRDITDDKLEQNEELAELRADTSLTKQHMSDAQLMHAERMARGEESYQGKLLESRDNDYKDEIVLAILTLPIIVLAWSVWTEDPAAMQKIDVFFEYFSNLPKWFTNLWILVVASVFGIKGTQIFRNGGKK